MLKNISDVMNNLDTNELDVFLSKTDASFTAVSEIKETKVDYTWLEVLEDTIPNLDKIVRNPRRFIIQEEDVMIIEKIKSVNQESVKHLSQHSENIQDIDEFGEVRPNKLLNVHKEDTTDLYENRFIYTLVKRLEDFMQRQLENIDLVSKKEIKRTVNYKGTTQIDNRKLNIELKMNEENEYEISEKGMNYKERILTCYEQVSGFKNTEMIKSLIGCTPVRNPIRKTNMILREPNFKKAFTLWENLDNFEYRDPKTVDYENITNSSKDTKDEFTLSYFIDSNAIDDTKENILQYKDINAKLNKLINEYVYEENHNINDFIKNVNEFYKAAEVEKKERENKITDIYKEFINKHNNKINNLNNLFN